MVGMKEWSVAIGGERLIEVGWRGGRCEVAMRIGGWSGKRVDMKDWVVKLGVEGWRQTIGKKIDRVVASRRDQVGKDQTRQSTRRVWINAIRE